MYNKTLLRRAKIMALKVDFITTIKELKMYSNALYEAMMWGKEAK